MSPLALFRRFVFRTLPASAAILCIAGFAAAQPLDLNFNPNANSDVFAVAAQPDGKILAGGNFSTVGGVPRSRLARINLDGSLDSAFNPAPNTTVSALAVQPDGRIVVGGSFASIADVPRVRLARLLPTGAIDSTFNAGVDNSVQCVAVQPDGKVLLGGFFAAVNSTARIVLARVNADGSLDTAFNPIVTSVTSFQLRVAAIAVQSDAKILIGGTFTHVNGASTPGIARLNADGSLDSTFSVNSGALAVDAIVVQPDNKILIGGSFVTFVGLPRRNLARLSPTGVPDDEVGLLGPGSTVRSILLQPDGKIIVCGFFGSVGTVARNHLARFNADGTFDAAFDFAIAGANGGSAPGVYAMASPAPGLLVFGGTFSSVSGVSRNGLARLGLPAPSILTAPRAQSVATGQAVSLAVSASGSSLSYQWLRNDAPIPGATNATFSIPNPTATDSGRYSVVVTNPSGSVTSAVADVTVDSRSVQIVQSPVSRSVAAGTDVSLNVVAAGQSTLAYQWRKDGEAIPDATRSTLALGWALPEHAGTYTVVVSDPSGSVNSSPAVLTVTGDLPFLVSTLAGRLGQPGPADGPAAFGQFADPNDLAVDAAGYVYVSDRDAHAIRKVSPTGVVSTLAGRSGTSGFADGPGNSALFNTPAGIAVDRAGNVFVADLNNNRIRKITPAGVVTTFAGGAQGSTDGIGPAARFGLPLGLTIDGAGNLYCTENLNHTVRKISPAAELTRVAGLARSNAYAHGIGTAARFFSPAGIAVDAAGNLYVADTSNHVIRHITPEGNVTTFAGEPRNSSARDGPLATARFFAPRRIALDPAGNLFVAATFAVRRIADGVVTTPIGGPNSADYLDSIGASARFSTIAGLATDSLGNLYISDDTNLLIRKATLLGRKGARLANLSVRSRAGTGNDTLIVGFNIHSGSKSLLLRAIGPTLATFGVEGTLADPSVQLESGGTVVAQNNDWDSAATQGVALRAAAAGVGAFSLPAQSKDAALLQSLGTGSFTAQIGGGTGVALVEVYDLDAAASGRLGNISVRTRAGAGTDTLILGFFIGGDTPRTVLIRGIGPSLSAFGVGGVLANPRLELYREAMLVAANGIWGGDPALASAFGKVGAFPLASESRDAVLLVTLLPGAYTAQLTGTAGGTGVALVEIYDVP